MLQQKMKNEFDRKIMQRETLKAQLHDQKLKVIKQYQEAELEGEMLRRQAEEELISKREKELQQKRKELENAQAIRLANLDIQLQHRRQEEKEAEEEALRE